MLSVEVKKNFFAIEICGGWKADPGISFPTVLLLEKGSIPCPQAVPPCTGCFSGVMIEFQENLDAQIFLLADVAPWFG